MTLSEITGQLKVLYYSNDNPGYASCRVQIQNTKMVQENACAFQWGFATQCLTSRWLGPSLILSIISDLFPMN